MRRWIATEGKYGEPPEDWVKMQAATWLGYKKTEVGDIPLWWLYKAIEYMNGEAEGQELLTEKRK